MSRAALPDALRRDQYRDATRLDARMALHKGFSVNPQGWHAWLFGELERAIGRDSREILELGCGPATLWAENAARIPDAWTILLSDFSAGMLDEARERLAGVAHPFAFDEIDATNLPLPDGRFDCVVANHMLYHVPDRPRTFAEIRRVLRPGGLLFASTLSGDTLQEMYDAVVAATDRTDFPWMRPSSGFLLDDGADQLAPFFEDVRVHRYEDALAVTEVEPLLAYYRSLVLDEPLTDAELRAIGAFAAERIARDGAFHVRKDGGVFLARKRPT